MRIKNVTRGLLLTLALAVGAAADIPSLGQKDLDLIELGAGGIKPSIACDSMNQPHIVLKDSEHTGTLFLYHKTASGWRARETVRLSDYYAPAGALNNPHIEIDKATDRAWLSSIMMIIGNYDGVGLAVFTRGNVSTAPTALTFARRKLIPAPGWATGNLSVEPGSGGTAGHAVGWINMGYWERWRWDNRIAVNGSGRSLFTMNLGERPTGSFRISRAEHRTHANSGTHGVWHAAFNGHPGLGALRYNGYQNSVRYENGQDYVQWLDSASYSGTGIEEDNFVGLATDNSNPLAAYMAIDTRAGEILLNIFNGANMIRSTTNPIRIPGSTGYGLRWLPQLAPAKDSGAWLCFTSGGRMKLKYFGLDGTIGPTEDICPGTRGSIAVDANGDIHLVYMHNSRTMYRRIATAALSQAGPEGKQEDRGIAFTWVDSNPDATDSYDVWVQDAEGQDVFAPTNVPSPTMTWRPPEAMPYGSYSWRIRRYENGAPEPWLGPMDFEIVPGRPALLAPAPGTRFFKPQDLMFTWSAVLDADAYIPRILEDNVVLESGAISETNFLPQTIDTWRAAKHRYTFQVASAVSGVATGRMTDPMVLELAPPPVPTQQLPAPAAVYTNAPEIDFLWTHPGMDEAWDWDQTHYHLWINVNGDRLTDFWLGGDENPSPNTWTLDGDVPFGTFTWWIRAWTPFGMGQWTAGVDFENRRRMTPDHGETIRDGRPVFDWAASPGATWYHVWVQKLGPDGGTKYLDQWVQAATAWDPDTLFAAGDYQWWVRGWNPENGAEPWLNGATFTVPNLQPEAAVPLTPDSPLTDPTPVFSWTEGNHASWHKVWVGRVTDNQDATGIIERWVKMPETTYTHPQPLPTGNFKWHIRTWNVNGFGPWSDPGYFTYGVPVPLTPLGEVHSQTPVFTWQPGDNAPWHQIWVNRIPVTGGSIPVAEKWVRDESTYTFAEPFPFGTYRWWVRSYEAGRYGPWSSAGDFTLDVE